MSDPDHSREQGVEFGTLVDQLRDEEFPMDKEALLDAYGSLEVGLESGSQTVRDLIEPLGESTFRSVDDVTQSVLNMVDDEAVGRKNYSDRGGEASVADDTDESM